MASTHKVKENQPESTRKSNVQGSKPAFGSHAERSVVDRLADHYLLLAENTLIDSQATRIDSDKIQTAQRLSVAQKIGHLHGNIQLQRMTNSSKYKDKEIEPEVSEEENEYSQAGGKPEIEEPEPLKTPRPEPEPRAEPIKEETPAENTPTVKLETDEHGEETLETKPEKALEAKQEPSGLPGPEEKASETKAPETPLESPEEKGEGTNAAQAIEKESSAGAEGGPEAGPSMMPSAGEGGLTIPPATESTPLQAPGVAEPGGQLQALASQVNNQRELIEGAVRDGQSHLILDSMLYKATMAGNLLVRQMEIETSIKTKSAELETLRKDQKIKIENQRIAQRQAVEQGYRTKLAELLQVYSKRFVEMRKAGDIKASAVSHFANRRAAWLNATTLTNVQRGLQIGENKAKSYKDQKRGSEFGSIARKIAARWTSDVSRMGGQIYFIMIKEGNDKANEIRGMALKAASKFAEGVLVAKNALVKTRDQSLGKIDDAAKAALAKVDPLINQAKAALIALKFIIIANLHRMYAGFLVATDIAVGKGISALSIAGQTRIKDLEEDYTNLTGTVAMVQSSGGNIAPESFGAVSSQYASAGSAYKGDITRGSMVLRGMLVGGFALVFSRMMVFKSRMEGSLAKLIAGVSVGLDDLLLRAGITKVAENAQNTMSSVVTKFDAQLGEAVSKSGTELDKAVNTSQQSIDQKAVQTVLVQAQHLGELNKQIDDKVTDMQRSLIKRVGLAILSVLAGVGLAAWKLIKGIGQAILVIALVLVAILAVVGLVFGALALLVGSATAALVALLVGVVLAAVAAIAAVVMMVYSLVKAGQSIGENFATAYADDTLTTFQRGVHAGEAAGDIAANVLPNIPKVGRGINRGIGTSFKWVGSKMGTRVGGLASTIATKAKGLYTKSKDILMANKPFGKVATAASKVRTFLKREVKLDEKGRPYLAPAPKPAPELAATLPPEKAPTLKPGEAPSVREPRGGAAEAPELAPTLPPEKAPTLKPGEIPPVRGGGARPAETPKAPAGGGEGGLPRGTTQHGMGPPGPPLPPGRVPPPPKLVRKFENDEAALAEALRRAREGGAYNIASPTSLREQWGILGEASKPPPAWIDSNGSLWIDGERVLGWWGGTKPPMLLPSGPGPMYTRKTVPYAESPVLNRPGANVPPELVKTLTPETLHGMGSPGPTLPPGSMPAGPTNLPPRGGTQIGLGSGPTLPPGRIPSGTTNLPPGGATQRGLGAGPTLPPGTMPPGTPTAPYTKISLGPEPSGGITIPSARTQTGLGPGPTLPPATMPPGTPTAPYPKISLGPEPGGGLPLPHGRTQTGLGAGPTLPPGPGRTLPPETGATLPPLPRPAAPHPTVLWETADPAAALRFAETWIVDMGREPRYWVNPARMREHWNEVMLRPGEPPPVYVSSDNVLHIDTTRVKIPDAWYIRGLPGGVPFNKPPKPGPTPPPSPGGESVIPGEPVGAKTIPDVTSPTLPGVRPGGSAGASRVSTPRTPARFQRETHGNPTQATRALANARSKADIRTPETACVVPSHLQALQATAENMFNRLGGERTEFAIVVCDDTTELHAATTQTKIGALVKEQMGALTDIPNKIIWINREALIHGVQRSWGATLNPKQVLAHEIGHAMTGSNDCAVASQNGAKLSGLTDAEKEGLIVDATNIKRRGSL
jgi:hypothetical protein